MPVEIVSRLTAGTPPIRQSLTHKLVSRLTAGTPQTRQSLTHKLVSRLTAGTQPARQSLTHKIVSRLTAGTQHCSHRHTSWYLVLQKGHSTAITDTQAGISSYSRNTTNTAITDTQAGEDCAVGPSRVKGWLLSNNPQSGWLVGCLTSQQHAIVYLRDGSGQAIGCAATLRYKLQIKLSTSPSHSILTPGQPVPALTMYRQAAGRVTHGVPTFKSLVSIDREHFKSLVSIDREHFKSLVSIDREHFKSLVSIDREHFKSLVSIDREHFKSLVSIDREHFPRRKRESNPGSADLSRRTP